MIFDLTNKYCRNENLLIFLDRVQLRRERLKCLSIAEFQRKKAIIITIYYMASDSQTKWSDLIGWLLVGISQYGPLPWKRSVSVFHSRGKFKFSKTQSS